MTKLTYLINDIEVATLKEAQVLSKKLNIPYTKKYTPISEIYNNKRKNTKNDEN